MDVERLQDALPEIVFEAVAQFAEGLGDCSCNSTLRAPCCSASIQCNLRYMSDGHVGWRLSSDLTQ
eukprot:1739071-Amphidinium_carterae.1